MDRYDRWQNQEEAFHFVMEHSSCMLDMDMGTGKTKVAIDAIVTRADVKRVLVVCTKKIMDLHVWPDEIKKHAPNSDIYIWSWKKKTGSVTEKVEHLRNDLKHAKAAKQIIILNYDMVWRAPMGEALRRLDLDMIILDESHRAKAAGSKVSKYLYMLGKPVGYKMCLTGTPMANSPLDVYGQYRFLDDKIFGTRHDLFLEEYAVFGGPERNFIVGFKNQQKLRRKFESIAYSCKMSDIKDRIKLPECLPPVVRTVQLPAHSLEMYKELTKEFIAECSDGSMVVLNNVLNRILRLQQITSGFCMAQDGPLEPKHIVDLNMAKEDSLSELLLDISINEQVAIFCVFRHDLESIKRAVEKSGRKAFELSGSTNQYDEWKSYGEGSVIAVQIQAGAEGISMTNSHTCIYYSLTHSLYLYEQSLARVYRPGQTASPLFIYMIAENTIDEVMYKSLKDKRDLITGIKDGTIDFGRFK